MKVNTPLNKVYRYFDKHPRIMQRYAKKTEGLTSEYINHFGAQSGSLKAKLELANVILSPRGFKVMKKIITLISNPDFSKIIREDFAELAKAATKGNFKSEMNSLSKLKSSLRKAFRQDPKLNNLAKELIEDFKNPKNKAFFGPLDKFSKSFSPENAEITMNYQRDTALLAPKEIRADYCKVTKNSTEFSQKPINEILAEILNNSVKK